MKIRAPAKINLGLHVLRRRGDGYHDVETVLLPVAWYDDLRLDPTEPFVFTCSDPSIPDDDRNLCVRAAHLLAESAGIVPRGHLRLDKRIPHGAGLGGGSSDAAATLRLLNHAWSVSLEEDALHDLGAKLGSDVPFFLHDGAMLATGRGDRLAAMTRDDSYRFPFSVAVVMPRAHVSTAEAYALVTPSQVDRADLRTLVLANDADRWRRELVNDFEGPILGRHPQIREAKAEVLAGGAVYASMSGSGAAVYGLFEDDAAAGAVADSARRRGLVAWAGHALTHRT